MSQEDWWIWKFKIFTTCPHQSLELTCCSSELAINSLCFGGYSGYSQLISSAKLWMIWHQYDDAVVNDFIYDDNLRFLTV